jgi:hypothetical protein
MYFYIGSFPGLEIPHRFRDNRSFFINEGGEARNPKLPLHEHFNRFYYVCVTKVVISSFYPMFLYFWYYDNRACQAGKSTESASYI